VVTKRGSELTVDLTDCHPQVTSFINSSYANMRASVAMALAYLIDPDIPKNDGTFRPLTVIAREGTIVWAKAPAPVTLCTNCCAQNRRGAIIKALCVPDAMVALGRHSHRTQGPIRRRAARSSGTCSGPARWGASPRATAGRAPAVATAGGIKFGNWSGALPLFFPPSRVPTRLVR
jgi:N-methylhydantoinase B